MEGKTSTGSYVKSNGNYVTSYREAWKNKEGRTVWTWRTDKDQAPHDFGTPEAAQQWIEEVLYGATKKERADSTLEVQA